MSPRLASPLRRLKSLARSILGIDAPARRRSSFARLGCEPLEERTVLAGNVMIAVGRLNINIAGDALANELRIEYGQINGVTGFGVFGENNTTINGNAFQFFAFENARSHYLNATMNAGDDAITVSGVGVANCEFNMGSGNDTVQFINARLGTASFTLGAGAEQDNDVTRFRNVEFAGFIDINGGGGANNVLADGLKVGTSGLAPLNIRNSANTTGAANQVTLVNTVVTNGVTVDNASGDSNTQIRALAGISQFGDIDVRNGAGNDVFTLTDTTVTGNVSVSNRDGTSVTTIQQLNDYGFKIGRSLNVTNDTGYDVFDLNEYSVGNGVTINNGNGDSQTQIRRHSNGVTTITGNVAVTNGTGEDTFRMDSVNVTGNVTINNGAAQAGTNLAGTTGFAAQFVGTTQSTIGGSLSVSYTGGIGSPGNDVLSDYQIGGNLAFNHGTGAFTTAIDGVFINAAVRVLGAVNFYGTGANTINVGNFLGAGLIVGNQFSASLGNASDTLFLNNLTANSVQLNLGNVGQNFVDFTGRVTGRQSVTVNGGSGSDLISSLGELVTASLTVNGGAGDDQFFSQGLIGSPGPGLVINDQMNANFNMGAGNDTVDIGRITAQIVLIQTSNNGDLATALNTVRFGGIGTSLVPSLIITGGNGRDVVTIENTLARRVQVTPYAGNDDLTLLDLTIEQALIAQGSTGNNVLTLSASRPLVFQTGATQSITGFAVVQGP